MSESEIVYMVYLGTAKSASGMVTPIVSVVQEESRRFVPVDIELEKEEFPTVKEAVANARSRVTEILRERTNAEVRFVESDAEESAPARLKAMKPKALLKMLTAVDDAIDHEIRGQREYRAKAKVYDCALFLSLAQMEQGHENQLRKLRLQVMESAVRLKGESD